MACGKHVYKWKMRAAKIALWIGSALLLSDIRVGVSFSTTVSERGLVSNSLRQLFSAKKSRCPMDRSRALFVHASLEEDLGKPFGDFGRKVGKSIDWFFDTSHVKGGM